MTKQVTIHKCPVCKRNVQRLASHMRLAHPGQSNEAQAPPPQNTTDNDRVIVHNEAFTKDDLLAAARRPASADLSANQDYTEEDVEYHCDTCNAIVSKTDKQCKCGRALRWGDI